MAGYSADRIRIGSLYSLTSRTVPALVMGLKLRKPELQAELVLGSNADLLRKLRDGAIDAALMGLPEGAPDIESELLFEDDIFFAAPAGSRYAEMQEVDLGACADERFVSLGEGFVTYSGFLEAFRIAGFTPNVVMRTGDIFSLMNLVSGGVGCTLLPGPRARRAAAARAVDPAAAALPDAPEDRPSASCARASATRTCSRCWRCAAWRTQGPSYWTATVRRLGLTLDHSAPSVIVCAGRLIDRARRARYLSSPGNKRRVRRRPVPPSAPPRRRQPTGDPTMIIYGTALLAVCHLLGIFLGDLLGQALGVKTNVGGVGIAMLLLIFARLYMAKKDILPKLTELGVEYWGAMYIPVVVAMAAQQDVVVGAARRARGACCRRSARSACAPASSRRSTAPSARRTNRGPARCCTTTPCWPTAE